jgi:DUF4097 and DUF4098 domain-containing protein YvlB
MNRRVVSAALLLTLALPLSAQQRVQPGERVELPEAHIEIFNAVGTVALHPTAGTAVTVTATAQGSDASQLAFETDHDDSLGRFRVVFPDVDRIATPPELGRYTNADLDLRRDGTFGGDHDRRRDGHGVRIGGSSGLQAWAALEIGIPEGANVKVHLAVGRANADGVNGAIRVDTWSADAEATSIAGDWLFDSGSGNVTVRGMQGTLRADTGSGNVVLSDMNGDLFDADTGSGNVEATDVQVERFRFDAGSGDLRASNLVAPEGLVDTGSGDANVEFTGGTIDDLSIDTGSGDVSLTLPPAVDARVSIETGSGDARVERDDAVFQRRDDDATVLSFGQGRGRVRIDTGSGDVLIR